MWQFFISSSAAARGRLVDVGVRDGGAADEARQKGQARTLLHLGWRFKPVSLCSLLYSCHDIPNCEDSVARNRFFVFPMAGRYPYGRADFVQTYTSYSISAYRGNIIVYMSIILLFMTV